MDKYAEAHGTIENCLVMKKNGCAYTLLLRWVSSAYQGVKEASLKGSVAWDPIYRTEDRGGESSSVIAGCGYAQDGRAF